MRRTVMGKFLLEWPGLGKPREKVLALRTRDSGDLRLAGLCERVRFRGRKLLMAGAATSLEVREACVFYGPLKVLDRVSLSAEGGEFIALLGSSGCGKTTLLRAICGFVPVTSGRIAVSGRDITDLPPDKRRMAMVFQSYALWPHMTVAQNIGYGLRLRSVTRAAIS